jgi:hypothetical protein
VEELPIDNTEGQGRLLLYITEQINVQTLEKEFRRGYNDDI